MKIGRKEALLALVAAVVPWMGRRASAQVPRTQGRDQVLRLDPSQEMAELQRRLAAVEAQLANQVAFTKDAAGNLHLKGNGNVRLEGAYQVSVLAGIQLELRSGGPATLKGGTIGLN